MALIPRSTRSRALGVALVAACIASSGCGGGLFGKVYEYEEDLYISLDGTASVIVNASIPALAVLRGLDLDLDSVTQVTRVSRPWRRNGRVFVQVRVSISDLRRLTEAKPFSWSAYDLKGNDTQVVFRQVVGPSAHRPGTLKNVGWDGSEVVAFRVHFPSRILDHNARDLEKDVPSDIQRGNILAWEQKLSDRLDGQPVTIQVAMDAQSILYRTLWLFGGAFGAAVLLMVTAVWLIRRKGVRESTAVS